MCKRLFLLSYFVVLLQIPLSFGTIIKTSSRDFVVERNGETVNIKIEGIPGIIDYFAEVKHENPDCTGCTMYLIRTSEGKYYVHHKKNQIEHSGVVDVMNHLFVTGGRASGTVLFMPGKVSTSYYGLPCYLHNQVDARMQTTYVPNLAQLSDGYYQIVMGPDITISESVIVGNFEIVEEATF